MTTDAYQNCTLYSFNPKSKECDKNLNRLVELNNQLNDKVKRVTYNMMFLVAKNQRNCQKVKYEN